MVHNKMQRSSDALRVLERVPMQEEEPKTNRPVRVLLADDHTLFRQGIAGLLASYGGLEVVAEVPNDQEALRLAQ